MNLFKLLLESVYNEQTIKDTHFAIDKSTGKIVRGWDYKGVDNPSIAYYTKEDLKDQYPNRKPTDFSVLTRSTLEKRGINVEDTNNWLKESLKEEKKKKPSAGLTKKQKSDVAKKARAGKDIGKKGKGFEAVAKKAAEKYGSEETGRKVAAAAMWKNIKREGYEGGDHEVSMAMNSLRNIISSAYELMNKLGNEERNIPGWIQDHIVNSENYIEQASTGFHELGHHDDDMD
jgi:hypothetical protein